MRPQPLQRQRHVILGHRDLGLLTPRPRLPPRYNYNSSHAELFFPATTYGCDPRDRDCGMGLAFKAFVHPPRLAHSMTDDELFWRASLVPRAEDFPFQRVPKVAFLFMTRGPIPFAPLWEKFFRGHQGLYSIYVHTLPDYKLNVSTSSAFYGRQIPSEPPLARPIYT